MPLWKIFGALFRTLVDHWPEIVGFLCALIPSVGLNGLIIRHEDRRLSELNLSDECREEALPVKEGRRMANFERAIYIWAVMFHHYELIAGWLVLKGFSEWATTPQVIPLLNARQRQGIYNIYLEGNALSILLGLLSGCIGMWVELTTRAVWP
jgi:hypothetical protein